MPVQLNLKELFTTDSQAVLADKLNFNFTKLIELGITSDSTLLTEAQADNSGISVRVSGDDKTLIWTTASNAWNSSCGFNVPTGFTYKINNVAVVTGPTITLASLKTEVAASADFAAFKARIAAL